MQEVEIEAIALDRLRELLTEQRFDRFMAAADDARALIGGHIVWNVNATAQGGGVAEMLQTLLAYVRSIDIDTRWLVLSAEPDFFAVTKRLHNVLHGEPGDGGPLGDDEHAIVARTLAANLDHLTSRVRPGDIVLLHDPQTAGMVDRLRQVGAHVVWRCHIGRDTPNAQTDRGWAFLRPLIENADAFVFSRERYAPAWVGRDKLHVITPSIDPFSAKNCTISDDDVLAALVRAGLTRGEDTGGELGFVRRDGRPGVLRPHDELVVDGGPLPADARYVVQVSRWDRLKDMVGVLSGFVDALPGLPGDVHLLLVGPDASGVTDDPEGAQALAECRRRWSELGRSDQERVHLVCLPMDDVDENAHLVNAIQRRAAVIVQKSLVEGFGLTVTEAMWKGRPVVASAIGGIQDQIAHGTNGLLLRDPHDLREFAETLQRVLHDAALSGQLGAAAHERVYTRFLGDTHLEEYGALFASVLPALD